MATEWNENIFIYMGALIFKNYNEDTLIQENMDQFQLPN